MCCVCVRARPLPSSRVTNRFDVAAHLGGRLLPQQSRSAPNSISDPKNRVRNKSCSHKAQPLPILFSSNVRKRKKTIKIDTNAKATNEKKAKKTFSFSRTFYFIYYYDFAPISGSDGHRPVCTLQQNLQHCRLASDFLPFLI